MRSVYILSLFPILYVLVLGIYSVSLRAAWENNVLAFVTSPFNFKEDFLSVYGSPLAGYWNNLVLPWGFMVFSLIYYHILAVSKRISPELVFWASTAASYVVSVLVWFHYGTPSTGTSIVGFCMVAFLFGNAVNDLLSYRNTLKNTKNMRIFAKTYIAAITLLVSGTVLVLFYWLGNNSYLYHFVGGAICGAFVIARVLVQQS